MKILGATFIVALSVNSPYCDTAKAQTPLRSECKIEVRGNYRYIDSNGIPNHATGQFPNRGNPNMISPQNYHRRVTVTPTAFSGPQGGYEFGVAVNGVMFDPGTAELWNGDGRWHYEALTGLEASHGSLGMDQNLAHVQPNGAYHYHGLPTGLLNQLDYRNKMTLVGWAADGYPIYGPFCYSTSSNIKSPLKELKSSYRLKSGTRAGGSNGPGGTYDGSFATDYEYVPGFGDLDELNGRTGVTPEFPKGTFYYVLTSSWPFIPRGFRGQPDDSFHKGPPLMRGGSTGTNNGANRDRQRGGDNSGPRFGDNGFRRPDGRPDGRPDDRSSIRPGDQSRNGQNPPPRDSFNGPDD